MPKERPLNLFNNSETTLPSMGWVVCVGLLDNCIIAVWLVSSTEPLTRKIHPPIALGLVRPQDLRVTLLIYIMCCYFQALRELPGHAKDIMILLALYREVAVPQKMGAQIQQFHPRVSYISDSYTLR